MSSCRHYELQKLTYYINLFDHLVKTQFWKTRVLYRVPNRMPGRFNDNTEMAETFKQWKWTFDPGPLHPPTIFKS